MYSNLSKFNGVQLLGGVEMNGEQIYTQTQEEIERLEQYIENLQYPDLIFKGVVDRLLTVHLKHLV